MGFIVIDYDTLVLVAVFAFAAIGFSRGWLTEFINTVLLVLLSILLIKPEMLAPILSKLNEIIKLIWAILRSGIDLGKALAIFKDMEDIIDPRNPYPVMLIVTIGVLAFQYAGTRMKLTGALTPLSRILGAILGAVNANIAISLVKHFILEHTDAQMSIAHQISHQATTSQEVEAASAAVAMLNAQAEGARTLAPGGVILALENAPAEFIPESYWMWIGGAVVAVAIVLLLSHFSKKPIGTP